MWGTGSPAGTLRLLQGTDCHFIFIFTYLLCYSPEAVPRVSDKVSFLAQKLRLDRPCNSQFLHKGALHKSLDTAVLHVAHLIMLQVRK